MQENSIIVIKESMPYDISEAAIIKGYFEMKYIPSIDELLDYRNRISSMEWKSTYELLLLQLEIIATDYLLTKKQQEV